MKIAMISLIVLGAAAAGVSAHVDGRRALAPGVQEEQPAQESADADKLYDLVTQARAELREMRVAAGLGVHAVRPQVSQGGRHERVEGVGEHGGRERGEGAREGDEEGAYLPKMTGLDRIFANGARLVLEFDPGTQVFVGSVTNTTARTLPQVRVEVHLDNGTELGPTKRIDLGPGGTVPVELGAFGNVFNSWVKHPEAGMEQGHGVGGEERGEGAGEHGGREGRGEDRGEHGGGEGVRPGRAAYRPVYNQLQILRGEMQALERDLGTGSR